MHISSDGLDKTEDLALLRAVLRSGARSAGATERTLPTIDDRFGDASAVSGRPDAKACVRASRKAATDS